MTERVRAHAWSRTPLGPVEAWSERLRLIVEQVLANPLVATVVCGPERILIYNDAAAQLYGAHHPAALGRPLPEVFPDGWAAVEAHYARAFAGESVLVSEQAVDTRGEGEATDVFDALLVPVRESDGRIAYVHMTGAEVGDRARREAALREKQDIEAALRRSEELRRIAVEGGRMGTWRWNLRDGGIRGDDAFLAFWGFPPSDDFQPLSNFADRMSPQGRAEMGQIGSRAIAPGEEFDGQLAVVNGPASGTWVRWRGRAEQDRPWIINGVSFDVTAQRQVEQRLRESEARHRLLVESWTQAVWEADAHGGVVVDSPSWRAATGQTLEERLGDGWLDAVHPDDRAYAQGQWREAIAARAFVDAEFRLRAANGGWRWTNVRAAPVLDDDGSVVKWAGMNIDIDTRKRAEAALRESEERQVFLLDLSDTLRPLSDPADIQHAAMRLLAEKHDVMRAGYLDVHADGDTMTMAAKFERDAVPAPPQIRLSDYGAEIADAFHAGRTLCVRDTVAETETEEQREAYEVLGVRSWIIAPLVKGGRLIAIVGVVSRTVRDWTQADMRLVDDVAERTWAAVERARAEAALRESEERFQQFSEASPDILWSRDAETLQWDYLSPAFEDIYGLSRGEAIEGNDLRRWLELIEPDDRHEAMACVRRVREGERVTFEFRIRRPVDGQIRWLRNTDFPIRDRSGRVRRIGGIGRDITDLKAVEAALTHSEQRLRILVEGVPQLVWRAIDNGDWTWASPQWVAFTGQPEPDSHHLGWLDPVHPDDRETARAAWDCALEKGGFEVKYRIRNAATGEHRWFQTRATPVRDDAGEITEWLGTSTDVHDLRAMQDRQKVLVAELQHRTRNLMGVVRATAESTLRASADLAEFGARYRDRLEALARVQSLLSRLEGVERIAFDELIESEFRAIGAINGSLGKVVLNGPLGVALRSSTVQTFALALHELATNAVKYGALAAPSGHLAVTWRLEHVQPGAAPWLHVDWHESGVTMPPTDAPPQGTGQGRQLIERALPYQLGARTTYVMGRDGIRCSIAVPVSFRTAIEEAENGNQSPS